MKKIMSRILSLALTGAMLITGSTAAAEESVFTQEMVERSLASVGNTQRLHKAIEKARSGEEVSIVYLGGSITEGAQANPQSTNCYAYRSAQLFAEKFMPDPAKLKYRNAGISGTPSLLGVTRCQQDVLKYQPDIVFVEFAVNDGTDQTSRMVYESLVRKLLQSETQPAVVLIFTLLNSGYSAQAHMKQVGKHYDLGMVSIYDAIQPQITQGKMAWSDYSSDYAHPNNEGHAFIAESIGYYFDQAAAVEPTDWVMPEDAVYGKELENLVNVSKVKDPAIVSVGSFPVGIAMCYTYAQGWKHQNIGGGDDPLVLELTASHMTIAFKQENNTACGKAEVWVDGKLKTTLSGHSESAWGNVVTELVVLGENEKHTIEIRMAEGDETKNFNVLDIGYAVK